mmetsp:Transcript_44187/g.86399  ORF Transcript_44187/g.86399 Transcript_44187/m.86399 type:complete len:1035 (+) Transcript_44187:51-3155(+)
MRLLVCLAIVLVVVMGADPACPTVSNPQDRRPNKNKLRLVQYNVEWLFLNYSNAAKCPGTGCAWANESQATEHLDRIVKVLDHLKPDLVNMCEVQGCNEMHAVADSLDDGNFKPYLLKGQCFDATVMFFFRVSCVPCPEGSICPGGGVAHALPGWWQKDENSIPVECPWPPSCPGYDKASAGSNSLGKCNVGYKGDFCADCESGFYRDGLVCRTCGLESAQINELTLVITGALLWFIVVALLIATLSPSKLASAVSILMLLQQLSVLGKPAIAKWPEEKELQAVFDALSFLNFNLDLVKPGCSVPAFTFGEYLALSYALLAASFFCCLLGVVLRTFCRCCHRACCIKHIEDQDPRSEERNMRRSSRSKEISAAGVFEETELVRLQKQPNLMVEDKIQPESPQNGENPEGEKKPTKLTMCKQIVAWCKAGGAPAMTDKLTQRVTMWQEFKNKITHSLMIVLSIWYLRLATVALQGVHCISVFRDGNRRTSVMYSESQIECYVGPHLTAAVFAWATLALYSIGFPVLILYLLHKEMKEIDEEHLDYDRPHRKFGYLLKNFTISFYWFKAVITLFSFFLVVSQELFTQSDMRLLMSGVFMLFLKVTITGLCFPYDARQKNIFQMFNGMAFAVIALYLLIAERELKKTQGTWIINYYGEDEYIEEPTLERTELYILILWVNLVSQPGVVFLFRMRKPIVRGFIHGTVMCLTWPGRTVRRQREAKEQKAAAEKQRLFQEKQTCTANKNQLQDVMEHFNIESQKQALQFASEHNEQIKKLNERLLSRTQSSQGNHTKTQPRKSFFTRTVRAIVEEHDIAEKMQTLEFEEERIRQMHHLDELAAKRHQEIESRHQQERKPENNSRPSKWGVLEKLTQKIEKFDVDPWTHQPLVALAAAALPALPPLPHDSPLPCEDPCQQKPGLLGESADADTHPLLPLLPNEPTALPHLVTPPHLPIPPLLSRLPAVPSEEERLKVSAREADHSVSHSDKEVANIPKCGPERQTDEQKSQDLHIPDHAGEEDNAEKEDQKSDGQENTEKD